MQTDTPNCAQCPFKASDRLCRIEEGRFPESCPTMNMTDLIKKSLEEYNDTNGNCNFARQAAIQEATGYQGRDLGYERVRAAKTRIEEIIEFARRMNYQKLGMAFCLGLRKEAKAVEQIFSSHGFEVVSAICKIGRVPKQTIGVSLDEQIDTRRPETMCNPILQAMILNQGEADFNILLGLCVGHDSLFFKYAEAPTTVLAVKDRLLGHNPLAAIYTLDSYYRTLK
ncbi:DUF1847 domain-containing protein [Desulfosediminicola ganghwensis]|uniref:DUF1847 domain-containing protein n=1 Tax=Desulfosediminicola ganghwensis TaxID=2569540 RepID=UPI0010AC6459|nr:DUF1847 domain-containing protein [Desulfosediminicola ganghwensis]